MNREDLKKFVEENPKLVSMKPAGDGIFVLKYKNSVFYDDLWNEYLQECRGTIVDEQFNIIQYPFTKIYNYGIEARAPRVALTTPVTAYRKINGFMAAITWDYRTNDILVSTTGSTDSDFVNYVYDMIADDIDHYRFVCQENSWYTYMFECVHPSDPHIVPEEHGMYLLGSRRKEYGSRVETGDWMYGAALLLKCHLPESIRVTLGELVELSKTVTHEGFVWYADDGTTAKIKSPHYLVSKFVARCNKLDKLTGQAARARVDEEYYPLLDAIESNIDEFSALSEQDRLSWVRKFYGVE